MLSALKQLARWLGLISEPDPRGVPACRVIKRLGNPPAQPAPPPEMPDRRQNGHLFDAGGPSLILVDGTEEDLPPAA